MYVCICGWGCVYCVQTLMCTLLGSLVCIFWHLDYNMSWRISSPVICIWSSSYLLYLDNYLFLKILGSFLLLYYEIALIIMILLLFLQVITLGFGLFNAFQTFWKYHLYSLITFLFISICIIISNLLSIPEIQSFPWDCLLIMLSVVFFICLTILFISNIYVGLFQYFNLLK